MKKLLLLVLAIGLGFAVSAKAQSEPCVFNSEGRTFFNGKWLPAPNYNACLEDGQTPILPTYSYIVHSGNMSIIDSEYGPVIYGSGEVSFQMTFYGIPCDNCGTRIYNYTGEIISRSSGGSGGTTEPPKRPDPEEPTEI